MAGEKVRHAVETLKPSPRKSYSSVLVYSVGWKTALLSSAQRRSTLHMRYATAKKLSARHILDSGREA